MKWVRETVPRTLSRVRAWSTDRPTGVVPTMWRAHAAWRASVVRRPKSAAVSRRSCRRGVTPARSATVRSSIATAVRVKRSSVSVNPWKSKNGRAARPCRPGSS